MLCDFPNLAFHYLWTYLIDAPTRLMTCMAGLPLRRLYPTGGSTYLVKCLHGVSAVLLSVFLQVVRSVLSLCTSWFLFPCVVALLGGCSLPFRPFGSRYWLFCSWDNLVIVAKNGSFDLDMPSQACHFLSFYGKNQATKLLDLQE
jgi:hypothetical protein